MGLPVSADTFGQKEKCFATGALAGGGFGSFFISEENCIAWGVEKLYKMTFGPCRVLHREAFLDFPFVFYGSTAVSQEKLVFGLVVITICGAERVSGI